MKNIDLKGKMLNATKWATITEILAKLITPITNIILARLLVPEAFGVVATIIMIISFAELFTDAGFQKYIIQHEFKDEEEKYQHVNVAFWTNLVLSLLLWLVIFIFSTNIASMVGVPGLGNVISIACIIIPINSFSSIQMALYRRDFDYRTLFFVRVIGIFLPIVVTIPLAALGFSYWALIIGIICGNLSNAFILTIRSKWRPKFYYKFYILKEMFAFTIWTLIESISIWLTSWIDVFIIGSSLSAYYLGLYKTSTTMVTSIISLITASTTPILFSALSRLQSDSERFNFALLKVQRLVAMILFPIGVGIFVYSDLITKIILGNQWAEASKVIGIWGLTSAIMVIFGNYCSEAYRAKGLPKLSFLAQVLHLIFLVPVCIVSSKYGFWTLVYARSLIRLQAIVVHFILMKYVIRFPMMDMFRNLIPSAISTIAMGLVAWYLQELTNNILISFMSIGLCVVVYFGVLLIFPNIRKEIKELIKIVKVKLKAM